MLFMGEEWAASTPWRYFTDHPEPALAEVVRSQRRQEFAAHGWRAYDVPDPQDPATFERSRLDWSELERQPHASVLEWYRSLVALRHREPALRDPRFGSVGVAYDAAGRWIVVRRPGLRVVCNLSDRRQTVRLDPPATEVLLSSTRGVKTSADGVAVPGESLAIVRV